MKQTKGSVGFNVVRATFSQNLPARVSKENELIPGSAFANKVEFQTSTIAELTGDKVGLWMLATLKHYMKLEKLQGRVGFKMNKSINVQMSINSKQETFSVKFTFSLERVAKLLERHPAIVTEAFTPAPAIGTITANAVKQYLIAPGKIVLAKAKKVKQLESVIVESAEEFETVEVADIKSGELAED